MAGSSESGTHEGEIHFSRLEALDPQKRELLEARFSTPRVRSDLKATPFDIVFWVLRGIKWSPFLAWSKVHAH